MTTTRHAATPAVGAAPVSPPGVAPPAGTAAHPGAGVPAVESRLMWVQGGWRPVRVAERDGWVTVEEAARLLRRRTVDVRRRARGLVGVGDGRPGSPRRYRLADLCPEVAVCARPRPSHALPGAPGTSGWVGVVDAARSPENFLR